MILKFLWWNLTIYAIAACVFLVVSVILTVGAAFAATPVTLLLIPVEIALFVFFYWLIGVFYGKASDIY